MSRPKPIEFEYLVAERLKKDYQEGVITTKESLVNRILEHDQEICHLNKVHKNYIKTTIEKSTLSRFLKKFELPTPTVYLKTVAQLPSKLYKNITLTNNSKLVDECSIFAPSQSDFNMKDKDKKDVERVYEPKIHYQEDKIKELTEISSGLSNKITPSALLSISNNMSNNNERNLFLSDPFLEKNIVLHSCIRAIIQVLSPIRTLIEWIIENDFLIVNERMKNSQSNYPFQQLANSWFWDGILKYESCEKSDERLKIIQIFADNFKEICQNSDKVFGTNYIRDAFFNSRQIFIPPAPQKIIDLIIQQHYNHFLDDLPNGEVYDLPDLPFKKIQLVPPRNTKPYATVSFNNWKPQSVHSSENNLASCNHNIYDLDNNHKDEEPLLLAELAWDREKLKYVNFSWPQFGEDIILKKGWLNLNKERVESDYQMVGIIWGRQFIGDGRDLLQPGILLQLGIDKPPVNYMHATKRGTASDNPRQGKWFLCTGDSSLPPLQFNNDFQNLLLYMCQKKAYQPQLFVFQKIETIQKEAESINDFPRSNSPVSFQSYEPSLKKKILSANCTQDKSVTKDINLKKIAKWLSKSDLQLNSKKKLRETLDSMINASKLTSEIDDKRFFIYNSESQYSNQSKIQSHQAREWIAYHATLKPLKKFF